MLELSSLSRASLAYRLLRYINSAFFGLSASVTSIRHALILMGLPAVRQWASLILMVRSADGKPAELLITGMVRAKMCELIGTEDQETTSDQYFTVGLFSILDALMDLPLLTILDALPLAAKSKSALTNYSGMLGRSLRDVLDYEQGRWDRLGDAVDTTYQDAYLSALQWCRESQNTMHS